MLTKEELNAIRERCEKATPGKWFWNSYESVYSKLPHGISIRGREICEVNTTKICDLPKHVGRDDAIFIEHVHSDIPSLLAHIEELEKRPISDVQIKHMVDRFLGWRLPEDFHPDAGISFTKLYGEGTPWPMDIGPIGTNLFTADQATEMVKFMIDGMRLD